MKRNLKINKKVDERDFFDKCDFENVISNVV